MIELRSDTFTLPSAAMRSAMATAPLGDDVYGEDPTVLRLERLAADRLGKAAACLMPSGTMANLAALMAHAPRGAKAIVGSESDIYLYEAAGATVCGGISYEPIRNLPDGTLPLASIAAAFPEDDEDPQFAPAAVICLENTQNRCGGVVLPDGYAAEVAALARTRGVAVHLDGARIFNAAVARGVPPAELAQHADTVQFCLSKGLAAPIGSMVAGDEATLLRVRRIRKMLGGGMRQAGVIAAAGILAIDEAAERLSTDHAHARLMAEGLAAIPGVTLDPPQTNSILFRVAGRDPEEVVRMAASAGVAVNTFGHGRIRAVIHCGVTTGDVHEAVSRLAKVITHSEPRLNGAGSPR
ncbi:GntG family PLP-dependent aldolase [Micromonospora sp. WMMA1998]|uniref:GntG family PLP-dependent aldolase n=1 Tax=unclassified Micromonospora TaxID=2617518 RepID=UPI00248AB63C|nr:GntG family PLP-dependent aldolase [Micromonospora sp. WMMA1998]WBC16764.1 GntG family PLP-dependent aldolase [Micromonospora sp. WMMA1998]